MQSIYTYKFQYIQYLYIYIYTNTHGRGGPALSFLLAQVWARVSKLTLGTERPREKRSRAAEIYALASFWVDILIYRCTNKQTGVIMNTMNADIHVCKHFPMAVQSRSSLWQAAATGLLLPCSCMGNNIKHLHEHHVNLLSRCPRVNISPCCAISKATARLAVCTAAAAPRP